MFKILWSPREGFEALGNRWWLPFVLVLVAVGVGVGLRVAGSYEVLVQAAMERLKDATPEQVEAAKKFMSLGFMLTSSVLGALVAFTIGVFVQALVFNLLLPLLGGEPSFVRTLSVVAGSKLPLGLGAILGGLLSLLIRDVARFDLGALFPKENPWSGALGSVEVFSLWSLVLLAEGLAHRAKAKRGAAYFAVFGLWLLWAAVAGAIAFLSHR